MIPGSAESGSQELLNIDSCLLQDRAESSFRRIPRVVWDRRIAIPCRVEPDLVAPRSLPVKLEPALFQLACNLSIPKTRESPHLGCHDNRVVAPLAGRRQVGSASALASGFD